MTGAPTASCSASLRIRWPQFVPASNEQTYYELRGMVTGPDGDVYYAVWDPTVWATNLHRLDPVTGDFGPVTHNVCDGSYCGAVTIGQLGGIHPVTGEFLITAGTDYGPGSDGKVGYQWAGVGWLDIARARCGRSSRSTT